MSASGYKWTDNVRLRISVSQWVKVDLRRVSLKNNHGSYERAGKAILKVANLRSGSSPVVELPIDKIRRFQSYCNAS